MINHRMSSGLCFAGVLLFALGLLTGFGIGLARAPRIALSAHLAATQCGIALVAFGLLWPHLTLWRGWSLPLAAVIAVSFYLIWIGLGLGALWGTGRVLPIAGAGHAAALWQERAAIAPVAIGSFGSLGAIALLLVQWRYGGPE
jgi:(hydroxyamino)benzene mutase